MINKKIILSIILAFQVCCTLYSQPTGAERHAKLHLTFLTNKQDTIRFESQDNKLISLDGNYEIRVYRQNYNAKLTNDTVYRKKGEISKSYLSDIDQNKMFRIRYYPSIRHIESNRNEPYNDIILFYKKGGKKMKITYKLYSSKGLFEGGTEIFMPIIFQEGSFEVTDPENPQLIAIKDDEFIIEKDN